MGIPFRFHQNCARPLIWSQNSDDCGLKGLVLWVATSNGQVEGQVNRLKVLKRQMYGRASHELLKKRFLCPV